jgi:hypothetical protein
MRRFTSSFQEDAEPGWPADVFKIPLSLPEQNQS